MFVRFLVEPVQFFATQRFVLDLVYEMGEK